MQSCVSNLGLSSYSGQMEDEETHETLNGLRFWVEGSSYKTVGIRPSRHELLFLTSSLQFPGQNVHQKQNLDVLQSLGSAEDLVGRQ